MIGNEEPKDPPGVDYQDLKYDFRNYIECCVQELEEINFSDYILEGELSLEEVEVLEKYAKTLRIVEVKE